MAWISGSALKAEVAMNQSGKANTTEAASRSAARQGSRRTEPGGGLSLTNTTAEPKLKEGDRQNHSEHDDRHGSGVAHAKVLEAVFEDQEAEHQGRICRPPLVGAEHELEGE